MVLCGIQHQELSSKLFLHSASVPMTPAGSSTEKTQFSWLPTYRGCAGNASLALAVTPPPKPTYSLSRSGEKPPIHTFWAINALSPLYVCSSRDPPILSLVATTNEEIGRRKAPVPPLSHSCPSPHTHTHCGPHYSAPLFPGVHHHRS